MNHKLKMSLVSVLFGTSLFADAAFVGGTYSSGSGSVQLVQDSGTYSFTDSSDVASSEMKLYAGYGDVYLFYQIGTIETTSSFMNDLDYSVFGLGYYKEAERWKKELGPVSVVPYYDIEIGYDTLTEQTSGEKLVGLLLGFDFGLAVSPTSLENVDITAGVGYEVHVANDDQINSGSWNFSSFNFNLGARYTF